MWTLKQNIILRVLREWRSSGVNTRSSWTVVTLHGTREVTDLLSNLGMGNDGNEQNKGSHGLSKPSEVVTFYPRERISPRHDFQPTHFGGGASYDRE